MTIQEKPHLAWTQFQTHTQGHQQQHIYMYSLSMKEKIVNALCKYVHNRGWNTLASMFLDVVITYDRFLGIKITSNTVMFRIRPDQLKFQRQCQKVFYCQPTLSKQWRFCCCNAKGGVWHCQWHAINAYKPSNTWATAANVTVQTSSCITALKTSNTRPVIPSTLSPGVSVKPSDWRAKFTYSAQSLLWMDTTHFCSIATILIPRPPHLVCVQFCIVYTECNSNKKNRGDLGMKLTLAENNIIKWTVSPL